MNEKKYYAIKVWDAQGNLVFDDVLRSKSSNTAVTNVLMNNYVKKDVSIGVITCHRKFIGGEG